jgi:hypothetical protein
VSGSVLCVVWPTLRPQQAAPALLCKMQDAVLCGGRVVTGQMETGTLMCGCMLLRDAYVRSPCSFMRSSCQAQAPGVLVLGAGATGCHLVLRQAACTPLEPVNSGLGCIALVEHEAGLGSANCAPCQLGHLTRWS